MKKLNLICGVACALLLTAACSAPAPTTNTAANSTAANKAATPAATAPPATRTR